MTQGVYLGRRAVDFQAALALKTALRDMAHGPMQSKATQKCGP